MRVLAGRLLIVPLKLPVPEPLVTLLLLVVGNGVVAQTMSRSVTVAPPSLVTLPPSTAVVAATLLAAVEVTVGATAPVNVRVATAELLPSRVLSAHAVAKLL